MNDKIDSPLALPPNNSITLYSHISTKSPVQNPIPNALKEPIVEEKHELFKINKRESSIVSENSEIDEYISDFDEPDCEIISTEEDKKSNNEEKIGSYEIQSKASHQELLTSNDKENEDNKSIKLILEHHESSSPKISGVNKVKQNDILLSKVNNQTDDYHKVLIKPSKPEPKEVDSVIEIEDTESESDTISINSEKEEPEYLKSIVKSQNDNQSNANFTIKLDVKNKDIKVGQMRLGLNKKEFNNSNLSIERKINHQQEEDVSASQFLNKQTKSSKDINHKTTRLNERMKALNSSKNSNKISHTQPENNNLFRKRLQENKPKRNIYHNTHFKFMQGSRKSLKSAQPIRRTNQTNVYAQDQSKINNQSSIGYNSEHQPRDKSSKRVIDRTSKYRQPKDIQIKKYK